MTTYLVRSTTGQRGDILVEDDQLTLELVGGWAVFRDADGPSLAVPAEHTTCIERIDTPEDTPPGEGKPDATR